MPSIPGVTAVRIAAAIKYPLQKGKTFSTYLYVLKVLFSYNTVKVCNHGLAPGYVDYTLATTPF